MSNASGTGGLTAGFVRQAANLSGIGLIFMLFTGLGIFFVRQFEADRVLFQAELAESRRETNTLREDHASHLQVLRDDLVRDRRDFAEAIQGLHRVATENQTAIIRHQADIMTLQKALEGNQKAIMGLLMELRKSGAMAPEQIPERLPMPHRVAS